MVHPPLTSPGAILDVVRGLISTFPSGIACHPSQGSLHQIIEEMPVTLMLARGELAALVPPASSKGPVIASLDTISSHFTDEDGRVHVTVTGTPSLHRSAAKLSLPYFSAAHNEAILTDPERFLGADVITTRIRGIQLEVPQHDIKVMIQVAVENESSNESVALAS